MKYFILNAIFCMAFSVYGQQSAFHTDNKKAIKLYSEANELIKMRQFTSALEKLDQAIDRDPDFIEAHMRAAFCYELLRVFTKQQHHLEEVIRISPTSQRFKNVYFRLAGLYYDQGRYEDAMNTLDTLYLLGMQNEFLVQEAERLRSNITFAVENRKNPLDITPSPLPEVVNAFPLQYFPVLTADENQIIFTRRTGTAFHDDEDIYACTRDSLGAWGPPMSLSPNINSRFNEGTCTISADGRILIFTTCEGRKSYGSCDLYMSKREGDTWSVPVNLGPQINSAAWESQPSLSADGRMLYFISDRKGGVGKRDIYVSEQVEEGVWSEARNLGRDINTSDDEVSPFIHVNGKTLFFSSRGYPGFGGFDIYYSNRVGSTWSAPANVGYPINDHDDQVSMFITTNGKHAYYSYEVENDGVKRSLLYMFEFPEKDIIAGGTNYLTGIIMDAVTNDRLEARVELYNLDEKQLLNAFTSDPMTGRYYSIISEGGKYGLYVEKKGYLFESRAFNYTDASLKEPLVQDFYLKPIRKGAQTVLNNIFFEFDSYKLKEESYTELEKVMGFLQKNPDVSIEIQGHTDDVGSEEYNLDLSRKRAESVYKYLLDRSIEDDRLTYAGYGERHPVRDNTTESNKAMNRRIEFKIIN
jgi:outer membrane protein OmpA-like peptidoglycan-associated protein